MSVSKLREDLDQIDPKMHKNAGESTLDFKIFPGGAYPRPPPPA